MKGAPEGRPKVSGGNIHQKLVEYAENRLRQEGIETILYEVDPGTGISIDIVGIKNGHRTGVECYVQAQIKKVRPRIPKLKVDRLIFCVPNKNAAEKYAEFGVEVWNAEIPGNTTVIVSKKTRDVLKAMGQKGESYDTIIRILLFTWKQHSELMTDPDEEFGDMMRLEMERRALL